jgi:hypothetical protein
MSTMSSQTPPCAFPGARKRIPYIWGHYRCAITGGHFRCAYTPEVSKVDSFKGFLLRFAVKFKRERGEIIDAH